MIATKDVLGNSRQRLKDRLLSKCEGEKEIEDLVNKLMSLDAIEYKTKDFYRGKFSSPDVENCIQKSDYHILNIKIEDFEKENYSPIIKNDFITREEQLMKLISLIMQPGIITPSFVERTMQIANTAKANSGCISRKVGAVILDKNLSIRSIGWNDVAKGHTPCNLRNVEDFLGEHPLNVEHYSDFELGNHSDISEYKYKTSNPNNFRDALKDFYKQSYDKDKLKGKNCSFCFKTVHNHYEGDGNQVHTRSLHAEENAMLQLTKYGGQGVENGILFTTASPCELCSKKAYQLGIKVIYYIDPYPGISQDQILKGGNISNRPKMMAFSGAMGTTYHKLYESFLSYKDELSLVLDIKPKNKLGIQFKNILESISSEKEFLSYIREKNGVITNEEVIGIIKKGLRK
ncbi:hypothetical protein [Flavobacterium lindanitolerans]|nr:hypothetical protein [Flavobacterium lindanitolerans]MDQ7961967.1 hypothetical protein [Flavobacterium lindanitolerans]